MILACVLCTPSFAAGDALATCMVDDRLPLRAQGILADMIINVDLTTTLGDRVWQVLASCIRQSDKSAVVAPYNLLVGDRKANVERFKGGPAPRA